MSDNLRDRIAKVLNKHYPQTTGYQDELTDWCKCGLPRDHVADAVIEALGLKITVDFLSADGQRRNWMVAGHCMMEAPRA